MNLWLPLAVLVSMTLKDAAGSCMVVLEAKGHGFVAAQLDTVMDFANLFCIGGSSIAIAHYGWSLTSVLVLLAIWIGSQLGTVYGVKAGGLIDGGLK